MQYGGAGNHYEREVKCTFAVAVGEKGRLTIEGKDYDFAKGALFLIASRDGVLGVQQFARDPAKLPADREAVVEAGKTDADVREFLSKAAGSK